MPAEEKKAAEPKIPEFVNPFRNKRNVTNYPDMSDPTVYRVVSMEVDKETLVATPVYEAVDSQKEIQACKDLCGLDYMKKLLASGQVSADDLQDNAGADYDLTKLPEDVHTAKRQADKINQEIGSAIAAAGGESGKTYNSDQIEQMISAMVERKIKEAQAANASASKGDAQ